jgi:hypothetical protein
MKEDIFGLAREHGLFPHPDKGGGHIHVDGASVFGPGGEDTLLFRNYMTDSFNSDRTLRIFESRRHGPAFGHLPPQAKSRMKQLLDSFDAGKELPTEWQEIRRAPPVVTFSRAIEQEVYGYRTRTERLLDHLDPSGIPADEILDRIYTQSVRFNFDQTPDNRGITGTFEHRGLPAQRDPTDFLLELELIEERFKFLKAKGGRIPLRSDLRGFEEWVKEMGLDPAKYRRLVEAGEWQSAALRSAACAGNYARIAP